MRVEELPELLSAMPPMELADHLSGRDVQGREQRGGAVASVVVSAPLDLARRIGSNGCVRSSAWIWPSRLHTARARDPEDSGRARQCPAPSQ